MVYDIVVDILELTVSETVKMETHINILRGCLDQHVKSETSEDRLQTAIETIQCLCHPDAKPIWIVGHELILKKLDEFDQDPRWPRNLSQRLRQNIAETVPKTVIALLEMHGM